ncbi:hypothetical protein BS17DRAFT_782289 [Gyrodon lividus]|nr:hypothetical protein BS17DRAFT_782289 [Gyrodon lividus]
MPSNVGLDIKHDLPITTATPPHSTPTSVTSTLPNSIAGLSAPTRDTTTPSLVNIPALHAPSRIAVDETVSVLPMAMTMPAAIVPSTPKKAPKMYGRSCISHASACSLFANLVAHHWLKHFKSTANGTTTKFNQHFLSLNNTQQEVANNAWNKDVYAGKMY